LRAVAINGVITKINEIGTVTYSDDSKELLDDVNEAYDALVEGDEAAITNAETLTTANTTYNTLRTTAINNAISKINAINYENTADCLTRIQAARAAYDVILTDDEVEITNYKSLVDDEAAFAVMQKIDAIGTIENTAASRKLVTDARTAYDDLEDYQEALVLNYQTLLAA
jgi:hypothetical protein